MATKGNGSGSVEAVDSGDASLSIKSMEISSDGQNDKTESNFSKVPGARLALITDILMEKNKPSADESDQDSYFDTENPKGVNYLPALRKQGLSGKRPGSFSTRSAADRNDSSNSAVVTDADIRRFVFLQPRSKRLMSGLKVHSLNKQTFLTSFSVGVLLGIFVALTCKLLSEFIFGRAKRLPRSI